MDADCYQYEPQSTSPVIIMRSPNTLSAMLFLCNAAAGCGSQSEKATPDEQTTKTAGMASSKPERPRAEAITLEQGSAPASQLSPTDSQQEDVRFGPSTRLVPFEVSSGKVSRKPARTLEDIVGADRYTVAIVASWCPYSQEFLRGVALGRWYHPHLIVFDTDEVNRMRVLDSRGDKGELAKPDALRFKLPYHFASSAQIGEIKHYPLVLECNGKVCTEQSPSDG